MQAHKQSAKAARERAKTLAIEALGFIAEQPQSLARFLDASGIEAEEIRTAARGDGFLAGVLEHMLSDETLVLAFAARAGIDPAEVGQAARTLGSG
ncbi:MAG: DUF3572 domain-containing protein [Xanthobacteraceae bacterium]